MMWEDKDIYILSKFKYFLLDYFNKYKIFFIILFIGIFIRAVIQALSVAMESSLDMQYYPAIQYWGLHQFASSINPYVAYLNGDIFMAQNPNYAPMLYVLMVPFALLDFENAKIAFVYFNVLCFLATLWVFYKNKISLAFLLLLAVFVVVGYTFNNVIANAQVAIFLGFILAIAYKYRHNPLILSLALSLLFVKYSFGVPILLGFFLAGYYKEVIWAFLINLCFYILFAYQFDISILESLLLPLKVSSLATGIGPTDLMSLSKNLLGNDFFSFSNPFLYIIPLIYALFIAICIFVAPPPVRLLLHRFCCLYRHFIILGMTTICFL